MPRESGDESATLPDLPHSFERKRYDAFRSRRHFGSLDGLRAIAILAVIWHHGPGQVSHWRLLHSGQQGVQLFFAISGFLITTLMLRERQATGSISLPNFYARRALRIFPLYYSVLALYIVLMLLHRTPEAPLFFSNLRYFFTYTANWFVSAKAVFGFAWSLATEEQFYLVWPSCEKYLPRKWVIGLMFVILAVPLVLHPGWSYAWIPPGMFRRVGQSIAPPICLGVLLAHLFHHRGAFERAFPWIGHPCASILSVLVAGIAIQFRAPELIIAAALTLIVATSVIREDHWLAPLLSNRALQHVGKISYGAYLMHGLAYNTVEIVGRSALQRHGILDFLAVTLLTVALASFSFRFYESFFLRLKRRFEPLKSQAAQAA